MKNILQYIKESTDEQKILKFISEIEKVLKDNNYKETEKNDKIYAPYNGTLYYFKDFDNIYLSYINNKQYGLITVYNNLNCEFVNIDNESDNQIEIISCDIKNEQDKNSFIIDLNNYLAAAKKEELFKKE